MMNMKFFLIIMSTFIILQPVLDILTTATSNSTGSSITVGIIARMSYMLLMIGWITYLAAKSILAKRYFFYLVGLAGLLLINFIINYNIKVPYLLLEEVVFYSKVIYFHVIFFGFLLIIREMKRRGTDLQQILIKYFVINAILISIIFIVAQITGTSIQSYTWNKVGSSGWFFAGNEIGAIMAIILPITALFAVLRTTKWSDIIYWVPFVALSYSMLSLGTKVGYGGIVIVLATVIITSLILLIGKKEDIKKKRIKLSFVNAFLLTILLVAATPFTPVFQNMFAHLNILGISTDQFLSSDSSKKNHSNESDSNQEEQPNITGKQVENLIFSSREQYVELYQQQFADANVTQKLFGMGYAGNYGTTDELVLKMIEMDFHDIFYSFGIIGFIYIFAPILFYSGVHVVRLMKGFKNNFNYYYILTGIAFLISLGIAYTAGHVLTSPGVSIYIAFLLVILIVNYDSEDTHS